jgi:hypothetical protein
MWKRNCLPCGGKKAERERKREREREREREMAMNILFNYMPQVTYFLQRGCLSQ